MLVPHDNLLAPPNGGLWGELFFLLHIYLVHRNIPEKLSLLWHQITRHLLNTPCLRQHIGESRNFHITHHWAITFPVTLESDTISLVPETLNLITFWTISDMSPCSLPLGNHNSWTPLNMGVTYRDQDRQVSLLWLWHINVEIALFQEYLLFWL